MPDLFNQRDTPRFNGADYIPARDDVRLTGQIKRVWAVMQGGGWCTLRSIAIMTKDPEASVSAQLRHLRKERFGGHTVEKKTKTGGTHYYRLIKNPQAKMI